MPASSTKCIPRTARNTQRKLISKNKQKKEGRKRRKEGREGKRNQAGKRGVSLCYPRLKRSSHVSVSSGARQQGTPPSQAWWHIFCEASSTWVVPESCELYLVSLTWLAYTFLMKKSRLRRKNFIPILGQLRHFIYLKVQSTKRLRLNTTIY